MQREAALASEDFLVSCGSFLHETCKSTSECCSQVVEQIVTRLLYRSQLICKFSVELFRRDLAGSVDVGDFARCCIGLQRVSMHAAMLGETVPRLDRRQL